MIVAAYARCLTELPKDQWQGTQTLALFDFDGTITHRDSLFDFIKYTVGTAAFLRGIALISPTLLAYRLGLCDNAQLAKQKLLNQFFNNWSANAFAQAGIRYAAERLPHILRSEAIARIRTHQSLGHQVVVVTASLETWVAAWCETMHVRLIASRIKTTQEKITGELSGANCNGIEKANRIKLELNLNSFEHVFAYGDTRGDYPMLELASHSFYRVF